LQYVPIKNLFSLNLKNKLCENTLFMSILYSNINCIMNYDKDEYKYILMTLVMVLLIKYIIQINHLLKLIIKAIQPKLTIIVTVIFLLA